MHNFNDQISDGQYRAILCSRRAGEGGHVPIRIEMQLWEESDVISPPWPPSCHSEAVDQLRCLLGRSYPHRQYLAHCWLTSLFRKLAVEGTDEIQTMITLVQKNCPLTGTSYPHRLYLADCWITSLYRKQAQSRTDTAAIQYILSKPSVRSLCVRIIIYHD
jgi:hypothetical protein